MSNARDISGEVRREREIATLIADQRAQSQLMTAALEQIRTEIRAGNSESSRRFDAIDERLDRGDAKFDRIDAFVETVRAEREKEKIEQARAEGKLSVWKSVGVKALAIFGTLFTLVTSALGWWISHHWPWLAALLNPPPPSGGH